MLDGDSGSFGPVRRTRQKSDLTSPSERHFSHPGNLLPYAMTSLHKGANQESLSSDWKTFSGIGAVPPQSIEMANKIFQELDKLVSSPREKISEKKGICQ